MLSIGWSELLIVAAVALIVVGPRDLPGMLRNLGKMAATVRRMGTEFRRELNKMAEVDDLRKVQRSVADPLRAARAEIVREFNKVEGGKTVPTGAIKPKLEGAQSVHDEIRAAAGMSSEPAPAKKPSRPRAVAKTPAGVKAPRRRRPAEKLPDQG